MSLLEGFVCLSRWLSIDSRSRQNGGQGFFWFSRQEGRGDSYAGPCLPAGQVWPVSTHRGEGLRICVCVCVEGGCRHSNGQCQDTASSVA